MLSYVLIAYKVVSRCRVNCCQPSMWNLPSLLNCILGYEDMGAKQGRETLIANAKKHCLGMQGCEMPVARHCLSMRDC